MITQFLGRVDGSFLKMGILYRICSRENNRENPSKPVQASKPAETSIVEHSVFAYIGLLWNQGLTWPLRGVNYSAYVRVSPPRPGYVALLSNWQATTD